MMIILYKLTIPSPKKESNNSRACYSSNINMILVSNINKEAMVIDRK